MGIKQSVETDVEHAVNPSNGKRALPLRRVAQPSLAEVAEQELRHMIVHGRLAPGERLIEPELCEALDISRTPLREALKALAAHGLVTLRRNRNSIVAPIDAKQLAYLFEVEAGIESMAASLAATRMTNTELKQLEVKQVQMEQRQFSDNLDAYFELNQKMHLMIVAGAKNPVLQQTHSRLLGQLERARYAALGKYGRQKESTVEHRAILEALKARDGEHARQLVMEHVNHTGELITVICDTFRNRK